MLCTDLNSNSDAVRKWMVEHDKDQSGTIDFNEFADAMITQGEMMRLISD
jgi:Ca2+-binding EF-hand superfamily protein